MIPWEVAAIAKAIHALALKEGEQDEWTAYIEGAQQLYDELRQRGVDLVDNGSQVAT